MSKHTGEQATAVYADVLGFSKLVMSMENCLDTLDGFYDSNTSLRQLRNSFDEEPTPNMLRQAFTAFHRTLDVHVSNLVDIDPCDPSSFLTPLTLSFGI